MTTLNLKHSKILQSLVASTLDTFQLNGKLSLLYPPLNKIVKAYLYNFYKNAAKFISLAQTTIGIDENH